MRELQNRMVADRSIQASADCSWLREGEYLYLLRSGGRGERERVVNIP